MHSNLAILLPLLAASIVLAAPTPMRPKVEIWDEPWKGASCSGHDCSIKREALRLPPGSGEQSPWFAPWEGPLSTREAKEQPPSGESPWFAPWGTENGPISAREAAKEPPSGDSPWFAPWKEDGPVEPQPPKPKQDPPTGDSPWFAPWNTDSAAASKREPKPQRDHPQGTPWSFDWSQDGTLQKRKAKAERPHGTSWYKDWAAAPGKREAYIDTDPLKEPWVKTSHSRRADDEDTGRKLWVTKWN